MSIVRLSLLPEQQETNYQGLLHQIFGIESI